jgi:FdrA protein
MESFYDDLRAQDVPVVHVDWRPPAAGKDLLSKLRKLKKV